MRKKIIALSMCIVAVFSLSGCVNVDVTDEKVKVDVGGVHVKVDEGKDDSVKVDVGDVHVDVE